jgi:hypothetical protein
VERACLRERQVTLGWVAGAFMRTQLLIRRGTCLLAAHVTDVVIGIPPAAYEAAASALAQVPLRLWVRAAAEPGSYVFALEGDRGASIDIEPLVLVQDDRGEVPLGLICRSVVSQALRWLPAEALAWTRLRASEIETHFLTGDRRPLRAALGGQSSATAVTLVGTPEAERELRGLSLDDDLAVRVVEMRKSPAPEPGVLHYLVHTLQSSILFDCVTPDTNELAGDVRVEIVRRSVDGTATLVVAPLGQRRYLLDVPRWMTSDEATHPRLRAEMGATLKWLGQPLLEAPEDIDDANLDMLLCGFWAAIDGKRPYAIGDAVRVVERWTKLCYSRPNVELTHALICVLALERLARSSYVTREVAKADRSAASAFAGDWHELATRLLRHIGDRALRSFHSEALSAHWLKRGGGIEHPRLQDLRKLLRPSLSRAEVGHIRQFSRYADLRSTQDDGKDIGIVGEALRRSMGDADQVDHKSGSPELWRVAAVASSIPAVEGQPVILHALHTWELQLLLNRLVANRRDITLLPPLPLRRGGRSSGPTAGDH